MTRSRASLLVAALVAYVAGAALAAGEARGASWALVAALPAALLHAWRRAEGRGPTGEPSLDEARAALRACLAGAALTAAARLAPAGREGFDALASLGTAAASVASLVALARVASPGGVLAPPAAATRLDAPAVVLLPWTVAVALPAARVLAPSRTVGVDPLLVDHATAAAGAGSLLVTLAATLRAARLRRLEPGVAERATASFALALAALAVGSAAAALGLSPFDRALPLAALVAGGCVAVACAAADPAELARGVRTALVVVAVGGPVALFAGWTVREAGARGVGPVLVAAALLLLVGLAAPALAKPLAPARSRWVDAFGRAAQAALEPDPERGTRQALHELRALAPASPRGAELFRVAPAEALHADRAGYLHVEGAELPEGLLALAQGEPERTLRADVLAALEVRRPELRRHLGWMRTREVTSVTSMHDATGPVGALALPRDPRRGPLSLEELRAVRALCDRLAAMLEVGAALARSHARELAEVARADREEERALALAHRLDAEAGRHEAFAARLARPAEVATWSPAARLARAEIERLAALQIPLALLVPPGIDAVAWMALAHLAGPRRGRPLLVVDGADAREHPVAAWHAPKRSPLALADGGTLAIASVAALPLATQEELARLLEARRAPSERAEPLDVALVVAVPATVDALVASGRLAPALADRLGDRAVPIPPLAARAEDLESLVLDRLARIGLRVLGRPLGVDPRALARLLEHRWPGNDAELDEVLGRAAARASGPLLLARDLDAIGFDPGAEPARGAVRVATARAPLPGPRARRR